MNSSTPVIYSDGTKLYDELGKTYIKHKHGLFILAPSGVGKTHFVRSQYQKHWIDGDDLYPKANADLTNHDWVYDSELVEEINIKSDVITMEARKQGFWVLGASNSFLKPDAIVIPEWEDHVKLIMHRDAGRSDGGATQADLDSVLRHREIILRWEQDGVPRFHSIEDAVSTIT